MESTNCQSHFSAITTDSMQFYKVCTRLTGYWKSSHNHHVFSPLYQLIFLQALFNSRNQFLGCPSHSNPIWPDTPPECKLSIDLLRGCIRQYGRSRTIF